MFTSFLRNAEFASDGDGLLQKGRSGATGSGGGALMFHTKVSSHSGDVSRLWPRKFYAYCIYVGSPLFYAAGHNCCQSNIQNGSFTKLDPWWLFGSRISPRFLIEDCA